MYGTGSGGDINPRIGTGAGLGIVALPSAGAGIQAAATSLANGFVLSLLVCCALVFFTMGLRFYLMHR
jgi:hypothetical protein